MGHSMLVMLNQVSQDSSDLKIVAIFVNDSEFSLPIYAKSIASIAIQNKIDKWLEQS
jgi:hypothetical protein